jgi:hypothetical protein
MLRDMILDMANNTAPIDIAQALAGSYDSKDVFSAIDELIEDGELSYDVEEDRLILVEGNSMKLLESQLRQIIREEYSKLNENYDDTLVVMKSDDREAKRRAIFDFVDDIGAFSPSDVKALLDATFDFLGMGEEQAYMHMLFIDSTLPIGAAVDGLRDTADEDFDPDRPR